MVYGFRAEIAFASAARRDEVLADILSQLATMELWSSSVPVAVTTEEGAPGLFADLRFVAQPAQRALINRIEQFLKGPRTPLAGSWYELHPCPHDEQGRGPCVIETRRVW